VTAIGGDFFNRLDFHFLFLYKGIRTIIYSPNRIGTLEHLGEIMVEFHHRSWKESRRSKYESGRWRQMVSCGLMLLPVRYQPGVVMIAHSIVDVDVTLIYANPLTHWLGQHNSRVCEIPFPCRQRIASRRGITELIRQLAVF